MQSVLSNMPDYEFKQDLAKTQLSCTTLALHKPSQQLHVIKIADTSKLKQHTKELIIQEAEILKKLNHPNVIKCHDSFVTGKYCVVITEFANYGDLKMHIKDAMDAKGTAGERSFLSVITIASFIGQIARGLEYIHAQGIIHRDLKPPNILLQKAEDSQKFVIKIADFGISKLINVGQMATTMIGTSEYSAPEVLQEQPYNKQCDMWSLGAVLYELVTLQMLSKSCVIHNLKADPQIKLDPSTNDDFKRLLVALLKYDPNQRIDPKEVQRTPIITKVLAKLDTLK